MRRRPLRAVSLPRLRRPWPARPTLFPYTTLFRSEEVEPFTLADGTALRKISPLARWTGDDVRRYASEHAIPLLPLNDRRSEEHTSELQSRRELVCRLLLEKKDRLLLGAGVCGARR